MTPGILNGLYVSSYVFLGHMPDNLTCVIPTLTQAYWTNDEIKNISTRLNEGKCVIKQQVLMYATSFRLVTDKCKIRDWNYTLLREHTFESAYQYITTIDMPSEIPCRRSEENFFLYDNQDLSIVPEVCVQRTDR